MNNLKIRSKLQLLLLLPIAGLLFLASIVSYERYISYIQYEKLNQAVTLSTKITTLVHELQKERGMTAGFIGTNGIKFKDNLPQQRELTDKKRKAFISYLNTLDIQWYGTDYNKLVKKALKQLSQLQEKRKKISSLSILGKDAIAYFTDLNSDFLEIIRATSRYSTTNDMVQQLTSYTNFLLSKERAGIERAIGAITFAADKFLPGMKVKFLKLITEQDTYIDSFEKLTDKNTFNYYKKTLQGNAVDEVARMRKIALSSVTASSFDIDSYYWFAT